MCALLRLNSREIFLVEDRNNVVAKKTRASKRSLVTDENRPIMKASVQIVCAIALLVLLTSVMGQRPSCWEYLKEDPDTIDQVYFPHEKNCQFYYQCSTHGTIRMKCQNGMHFDRENHQCGRPDEVEC